LKHKKTGLNRGSFHLLLATRNAQAAKMTLRPGTTSDDQPSNEHPHCEQWLFVISGHGEAVVGKRRGTLRRLKLLPNSLLLIEKGELHQIKKTGKGAVATINFYVPTAYDNTGEPRDSAVK
jgi:mannose-6-phosphate isomerase-like protein (cupin superfamily)